MKPFLVDTGKGFSLQYRNRSFYSSRDPLEKVLKKIQSLTVLPKTLVVVPSLGLGYGLQALLETIPRDCHLFCLEVDPVLMNFALSQDNVSLPENERFHLLPGSGALAALESLGIHLFRRLVVFPLSGGYGLFRKEYDALVAILEERIRNFWQNKMTMIHMGPLWVKNLFSNLRRLSRQTEPVRGRGPVVIAGAGPGLEESIGLLKKARSRIRLLAVDTAFPVLLRHNITPDFLLVVEGQILNIGDFIYSGAHQVPVLCDLTSHPSVMRLFKGPLHFFCSCFTPLGLWERLKGISLVPPLGSVGITALYLGRKLTAGKVFYTGLDFSYTKNKTHANGSFIHDYMLINASRLFPPGQWSYDALRKRPLLRIRDKQNRPLLTDLILRNYALQGKALIQEEPGFFDINPLGPSWGAPFLEEKAFLELLGREPAPEKGFSEASFSREWIGEVLRKEIILLRKAVKLLSRKVYSPELWSLLETVNYSYFHFPETVSFPEEDPALLLRIHISLVHYLEILERQQSRL